MFKKENGITLVALVVTIIVLLILAGVSISMLVGDNGVASRAQDAASDTSVGNAQDAVNLAISAVQTDYYADFAEDPAIGKPKFTGEKINAELSGYQLVEVEAEEGTEVVGLDDVLATDNVLALQENGRDYAAYIVTFKVGASGNITSAVVTIAEEEAE